MFNPCTIKSLAPASFGETQQRTYPDWIRVKEACVYARVSKPTLYSLMNRGLIKNVSLKERGQVKGARLISFDSLRNFLESRATGGNQE